MPLAPPPGIGVSQRRAAVAILAGYALLVFHHLGAAPLWNDEGLSFYVADGGILSAFARISLDVHPPLYYAALAAWLHLGQTPAMLRALSAVAAILAAGCVWLAARVLSGERAATLSLLCFTLSPEGLLWAQKARPYALQTMLVALSFWGFAQLLVALARNDGPPPSRRAWLAYVLGGGLAMLAQHPAGFYVLGCNAAFVACLAVRRPVDWRRSLLRWLLAQLAVAAIWLSWAPVFLHQVAEHLTPARITASHGIFLVASPWPEIPPALGLSQLWRLQPLAIALCLGLLAVGWLQAARRRQPVLWVGLVWAVPLVVCLLGFWLVHPVFGYVISVLKWLSVPTAVLVGHGLAVLRPKPLRLVALLLLVALQAKGLANYFATSAPRLDLVAQAIAGETRPGDGILFSRDDSCRFAVMYYLPPDKAGLIGADTSLPHPDSITSLPQALAAQRLWVVLPTGEEAAVPAAQLMPMFRLAAERRFGEIVLRRYDHNR